MDNINGLQEIVKILIEENAELKNRIIKLEKENAVLKSSLETSFECTIDDILMYAKEEIEVELSIDDAEIIMRNIMNCKEATIGINIELISTHIQLFLMGKK